MNQHKKTWLLLLFTTYLFLCWSVSAFATVITPEQVEKMIQEQEASKAAQSKSAETGNTGSAVSSKWTRRTYSSMVSSEESSSLFSSESSYVFSSEEASSEIVLPSVGSIQEENPLSSVTVDTATNKKMNWIGIISWICIALGVIVVLIVVFSNRRPPSGPGRKRYRRPNRSRKKHLLNDKYYRNIRY
jgi:hypothetical protein